MLFPEPGSEAVNAVNPVPQTDNTPLTVGAVGVGFTVNDNSGAFEIQPVVGLVTCKFIFLTPAEVGV